MTSSFLYVSHKKTLKAFKMDGKNTTALTYAHRKAKQKVRKIKELGITSKLSDKKINEIIKALAVKRADDEANNWEDHISGYRMYVEGLVKFSGFTSQEKLDYEYDYAFSDVASESQMIDDLDTMSAA